MLKRRLMVLLVLVLILPTGLSALTLKIGTLAPTGTPWDAALRKLAAQWSELSGGRINVIIYPGAIAGGEGTMIRNIRIGQLQGAALTGTGMEGIVSDVFLLDVPFLFTSQAESEYVLKRITPEYKALFAERGFVLLGWTIAGWINFFSTNPVVSPRDLQVETLAVSGVNPAMVQAWKNTGFHVLPLDTPSLMSALSSGMIDALYTSPLAAASYQWFGIAKYMCSLDIAPLIGGIVLSEQAWRQIPESDRIKMEAATQDVIKPLYDATQQLTDQAIQVMEQNGLTVNRVPSSVTAQWRSLLEGGIQPLIGNSYSSGLYAKIKALIAQYRGAHGG